MTELEKAYLAGLFDGEGCIGYYRNRKRYAPVVSISNTDARIIAWLHARLGGVIEPGSKKRPSHWKCLWEWRLRSKNQIIAFLSEIRPFLRIKGEQADLLLSHLSAEQEVPSIDVSTELKRLKAVEHSMHSIN